MLKRSLALVASVGVVAYSGNAFCEDKLTLIQAQVFHRHGDRTPTCNLEESGKESDIWCNILGRAKESIQTEGYTWGTVSGKLQRSRLIVRDMDAFSSAHSGSAGDIGSITANDLGRYQSIHQGILTPVGELQCQEIGAQLRERYAYHLNLISREYQPNEIKVTSTNFLRTIYSVDNVLLQLYPVIGKNVKIPVHIEVPGPDSLAMNYTPELAQYLNERRMSDEYLQREKIPEIAALKSEMLRLYALKSEMGPSKYNNMWTRAHDTIHCRMSHDIDVPIDGFDENTMSMLHDHMLWRWCNYYNTTEALCLGGSKMFEFVSQHLSQTEEPEAPKLILNSCHDTTLFMLLMCFKRELKVWPGYSDYISIELLHDSNQQRFVRVLYNGKLMNVNVFGEQKKLLTLQEFQNILGNVKN